MVGGNEGDYPAFRGTSESLSILWRLVMLLKKTPFSIAACYCTSLVNTGVYTIKETSVVTIPTLAVQVGFF